MVRAEGLKWVCVEAGAIGVSARGGSPDSRWLEARLPGRGAIGGRCPSRRESLCRALGPSPGAIERTGSLRSRGGAVSTRLPNTWCSSVSSNGVMPLMASPKPADYRYWQRNQPACHSYGSDHAGVDCSPLTGQAPGDAPVAVHE